MLGVGDAPLAGAIGVMGVDRIHRPERREVPVDVKPEEAAIRDKGTTQMHVCAVTLPNYDVPKFFNT